MSLGVFTIDDKIAALEIEIKEARQGRRDPGSALHRHYKILQAIASDLRARQQLPRSQALGALSREIELMKSTAGPTGHYQDVRAIALANVVIGKWPIISQALEQFGEESAE